MTPEVRDRIEQIRNGNVPEGYKKGKMGIVPVEWDEVPFSTLFTSTSEYTDDLEQYPLYSLTIENGITAKTERYERSHLVKKENSYKVVRPNDYAYNPMNIRFGAVARHKGDIPVAVSGYYDIFTTVHESDLVFMDSFLTCGPMITYYNKVSTGSLIEKQRVHFSDFLEFSLALPPLEERKKIAEILATQDEVIELEGQKIEEIKKAKQFFLGKMFPKKGQSVPEIRFKGFTAAWEQRKLGDVGSCQSGIGFPDAEQGGAEGIPFFKVSDMNLSGNEYELLSSNNYVSQEQIERKKWKPITQVPAMFFAKVGAAVLLNRKRLVNTPFLLDNNTMAYIFGEGWDTNFGRTLFDTINLASLVQVGALPSYNAGDVEGLEISMPSIEEQQQIGTYFRNLGHLITLHQRKLEQEKQKKKALMQLLLTGVVRV